MPRVPVLTISGYPKREAYRALDAALAERDAERAVCLAAELAATPKEPRCLASHLADAFAESYVTLDPRALVRMSRAIALLAPADFSGGGGEESRRAMCDAVLTVAIGVPRHEALSDILKRCPEAAPAADARGQARAGEATAGSLKLAVLMRSHDAPRAVALAWDMVRSEGKASDGMPFRAAWDACAACASEDQAAAAYVAAAASIFSGGRGARQPSRTSRARRAPLLLYAVLVASQTGGFRLLALHESVRGPQRGLAQDLVDAALARAAGLIGAVFGDILGMPGLGAGESGGRHGSSAKAAYEDPVAAPGSRSSRSRSRSSSSSSSRSRSSSSSGGSRSATVKGGKKGHTCKAYSDAADSSSEGDSSDGSGDSSSDDSADSGLAPSAPLASRAPCSPAPARPGKGSVKAGADASGWGCQDYLRMYTTHEHRCRHGDGARQGGCADRSAVDPGRSSKTIVVDPGLKRSRVART